MKWLVIATVMVWGSGCADASGGFSPGPKPDTNDECLNGGCDEYEYDDQSCWNGGCDDYGDGDYWEDAVAPADAVELGQLEQCGPKPECDVECVIDLASGESNCSFAWSPFQVLIDMSDHEALTIRASMTSPTDYALHLSDSSSNDGGGGDASNFSNDAELYMVDNGLYVVGNDTSVGEPGRTRGIPNVLPPEGGVLEMTIADGTLSVRTDDAMCRVERAADLLRLDAPDTEGTPDRLWYLGLNQVYVGDRIGSGLDRVELCFH